MGLLSPLPIDSRNYITVKPRAATARALFSRVLSLQTVPALFVFFRGLLAACSEFGYVEHFRFSAAKRSRFSIQLVGVTVMLQREAGFGRQPGTGFPHL